jgi:lipopolysaccharide transport system permease protein
MSLGTKATVVDAAWQPSRFGLLGWFAASLSRHWDLLWQLTLTDLRGRYVGSSLGLFWSVIHPLVMIGIYTIVFSRVMGARLAGSTDPYAYGLYLCAALLPWMGFQEVVTRCTTLFPDNANLVRKVAFPKSILYGYVALSAAINTGLAITVFLVGYVATGHAVHPTLLGWLGVVLLQLAFGLGIGIVTSVAHVFLRDTAQLVTVLFQLAFWATPIVYVADVLPGRLHALERFNPLHLFSSAHRTLVLDGRWPAAVPTTALVALTGLMLAAGLVVYRRFRADILDEL